MSWQCYLYGHQLRHPGVHEVVLTADNGLAYPFECERCGDVQFVGSDGTRW